jgi:hypothetical protein
MIELTLEEAAIAQYKAGAESSRSQFVTLKQGHNARYRPFAFTEQGVAMLSSVLKSPSSVRVTDAAARHHAQGLLRRVNDLEAKYDGQFREVFTAIRRLMEPPRNQIGFPVASPKTKGGSPRINGQVE